MHEELTDEQREELHDRLVEQEQALETVLLSARESSKPVDLEDPIGRLSRMDALQQQSMAKAHRGRLEVQLRLTKQALVLFERGEYGLCRFCEEPIGYKRLKAKPESPMCVPCQSERESSTR